jgi:cysteine-rich CPXCG protein
MPRDDRSAHAADPQPDDDDFDDLDADVDEDLDDDDLDDDDDIDDDIDDDDVALADADDAVDEDEDSDELDEDFPLGDGAADGAAIAHCPYCGEPVELLLDAGGGDTQEYVEDCEVCCRPWRVRVRYDRDGGASVELRAMDE